MGVPEVKQRESARDTLELCTRIFNKIGAEIHPYDLNIAHRVPSRNTSDLLGASPVKVLRQPVEK